MIYSRKITGNESEAFRLLIDRIIGIQGLTHFPRIPIGEVRVVTESFDRFAGSGKLVLRKPYLADKDDLIAFDKTTQTIVYNFKYIFEGDGTEGGSTKTLIIGLRWFSSNWVVYPIAAVLMHAANDIDISDDNFRVWLINNRPKVNKAEKMDIPEKNNELFKFLQLRERSGDVKITQEMGQELFKALFDRANAIAHEEVSGDALATDTSEFMLALVNNIINSAPKPKPFAIQPMDLDEQMQFLKLSFEYEQRCGLAILSGSIHILCQHSEQEVQAVAQKVFGEPVKTQTDVVYFLFKVNGIVCRAVVDRCSIIMDVHRESGKRGKILCAIRNAIEDAFESERERLNGKK